MLKFEVTVIMPDATGKTDVPPCRDAEIIYGRSGFLIARFTKADADMGFAVNCALTDLAIAVPGGDITKIEFSKNTIR